MGLFSFIDKWLINKRLNILQELLINKQKEKPLLSLITKKLGTSGKVSITDENQLWDSIKDSMAFDKDPCSKVLSKVAFAAWEQDDVFDKQLYIRRFISNWQNILNIKDEADFSIFKNTDEANDWILKTDLNSIKEAIQGNVQKSWLEPARLIIKYGADWELVVHAVLIVGIIGDEQDAELIAPLGRFSILTLEVGWALCQLPNGKKYISKLFDDCTPYARVLLVYTNYVAKGEDSLLSNNNNILSCLQTVQELNEETFFVKEQRHSVDVLKNTIAIKDIIKSGNFSSQLLELVSRLWPNLGMYAISQEEFTSDEKIAFLKSIILQRNYIKFYYCAALLSIQYDNDESKVEDISNLLDEIKQNDGWSALFRKNMVSDNCFEIFSNSLAKRWGTIPIGDLLLDELKKDLYNPKEWVRTFYGYVDSDKDKTDEVLIFLEKIMHIPVQEAVKNKEIFNVVDKILRSSGFGVTEKSIQLVENLIKSNSHIDSVCSLLSSWSYHEEEYLGNNKEAVKKLIKQAASVTENEYDKKNLSEALVELDQT